MEGDPPSLAVPIDDEGSATQLAGLVAALLSGLIALPMFIVFFLRRRRKRAKGAAAA